MITLKNQLNSHSVNLGVSQNEFSTMTQDEKRTLVALCENAFGKVKIKKQTMKKVKNESVETTPKGKRGRPSNPNSARSKRLAAQAERIANGGSVKRGRPAKAKAE